MQLLWKNASKDKRIILYIQNYSEQFNLDENSEAMYSYVHPNT